MTRRSNQDILLLIAQQRASPNVQKTSMYNLLLVGSVSGALGCALWQR